MCALGWERRTTRRSEGQTIIHGLSRMSGRYRIHGGQQANGSSQVVGDGRLGIEHSIHGLKRSAGLRWRPVPGWVVLGYGHLICLSCAM